MSSIWDGQANFQGAASNAQAAQHFGQQQAAVQTPPPQVRPDPAHSDFGWALVALRLGHRACRRGWSCKGVWLELQHPDTHSKMTLPYLYMKTADDNLVPVARQPDRPARRGLADRALKDGGCTRLL